MVAEPALNPDVEAELKSRMCPVVCIAFVSLFWYSFMISLNWNRRTWFLSAH